MKFCKTCGNPIYDDAMAYELQNSQCKDCFGKPSIEEQLVKDFVNGVEDI